MSKPSSSADAKGKSSTYVAEMFSRVLLRCGVEAPGSVCVLARTTSLHLKSQVARILCKVGVRNTNPFASCRRATTADATRASLVHDAVERKLTVSFVVVNMWMHEPPCSVLNASSLNLSRTSQAVNAFVIITEEEGDFVECKGPVVGADTHAIAKVRVFDRDRIDHITMTGAILGSVRKLPRRLCR